jgi:integral membrane protein (TIGR01906 family)
MKTMTYKLISIIFSVLLFFVLLFSTMQVIVYNLNYYENHYIKRDISSDIGMELDDLMDVTKMMIEYLKDTRETLDMTAPINGQVVEVFGEREKAHMVDVKNLFVQATMIRNVSLLLMLLLIVGCVLKNRRLLIEMLGGIKYTFAVIIALLIALGSLFYIDFNKYFIIFHKIFFDNDLWILSASDVLVNMVPEAFFFETAMIIIVIFIISIIVTIVVAETIKKRLNRELVNNG